MASELSTGEILLDISEAKPCPFCGHQPSIQPWPSATRGAVMINCANYDDCPLDCSFVGESKELALLSWNKRFTPGAPYSYHGAIIIAGAVVECVDYCSATEIQGSLHGTHSIASGERLIVKRTHGVELFFALCNLGFPANHFKIIN